MGHTGEEFLRAYGVNVEAQNEAALEESPVAQAILGFLKEGEELIGTASELLATLIVRPKNSISTPRTKVGPKPPTPCPGGSMKCPRICVELVWRLVSGREETRRGRSPGRPPMETRKKPHLPHLPPPL